MKIMFDAAQQETLSKGLCLNAEMVELDEAGMKEVKGGIAPGGCVILPKKPPIYTTLALGEEDGGPIATTLAIGEEDGTGLQ
ncbi:hypothetical protein [Paenibacillus kobensis]|uniref:hypothetical protein n=1 Tax=Paenibacillus kobensis TaxID=59841 RepID=UPI000FDCBD68|nr:hypothetical protein [Paenibacillus kobensis]